MALRYARSPVERRPSHGMLRRHCRRDDESVSSGDSTVTDVGSYSCVEAEFEKKPSVMRRLLSFLRLTERHCSQHKPRIGLYLARPGDTLPAIASHHEMHEKELRALNRIRKPEHLNKKQVPGKHLMIYQRLPASRVRTQYLRPPSAITLHDLPPESQCECDEWNLCTCRSQQEFSRGDKYNNRCHYASFKDLDANPAVDTPRANLIQKLFQRCSKQRSGYSSDHGNIGAQSLASCQDQSDWIDCYGHRDRLIGMHRSRSERAVRSHMRAMVLPELLHGSNQEILCHPRFKNTLVAQIENCLPYAYRGYDWTLTYSCMQHGASMSTMLHKLHDHRASLVLIETADGEVFGAFNATTWKRQPSYYGSGESFVFSSLPRFEFFPWTRANTMFTVTNDSSMAMGGGGGGFAWCLNADFTHGTTNCSKTFNNQPFSKNDHFDVVQVEAWTFVPKY